MKALQKGFTLIEIMVVVVIAAVLIGAVTIAFPPVGDKLLQEEADRFSSLIALAQDEAILQSNTLAFEVTEKGYSFYKNQSNNWVPISERPFTKRNLAVGVSTEIYLDGILVDLEEREEDTPQVVILSSGEMTPFDYILKYKNRDQVTFKVDATGDIETIFSKKE